MKPSDTPVVSRFYRVHLTHEDTVVSLVKIIVITLMLILSVLFFWRFLF
jgi:hypothetical protein